MFSRRHPYLFFILLMTSIISLTNLLLNSGSLFKSPASARAKIGVVEIYNLISDSKQVLEDIKKFREDKSVAAIVLRLNSPGGGVGPSQEIYKAVSSASRVKPVIASFGSVAASGAYYIAAASDGIMANPGTITGSIGVIMSYANLRNIIEKIGLEFVVIKSGVNKDMASPLKELSKEEEKILQSFVDDLHRQFVLDVAAGRKLDEEKVAELADGRIYTGREALELGLIDSLGNYEDALNWAAEKAGLSEKSWQVVYPERRKSWLVNLMEEGAESMTRLVESRFYTDSLFLYR